MGKKIQIVSILFHESFTFKEEILFASITEWLILSFTPQIRDLNEKAG